MVALSSTPSRIGILTPQVISTEAFSAANALHAKRKTIGRYFRICRSYCRSRLQPSCDLQPATCRLMRRNRRNVLRLVVRDADERPIAQPRSQRLDLHAPDVAGQVQT